MMAHAVAFSLLNNEGNQENTQFMPALSFVNEYVVIIPLRKKEDIS